MSSAHWKQAVGTPKSGSFPSLSGIWCLPLWDNLISPLDPVHHEEQKQPLDFVAQSYGTPAAWVLHPVPRLWRSLSSAGRTGKAVTAVMLRKTHPLDHQFSGHCSYGLTRTYQRRSLVRTWCLPWLNKKHIILSRWIRWINKLNRPQFPVRKH